MQNNTLILLKAQFLNQSGVNTFRYESDKKKKNRVVILVAIMTILIFMLSLYCFGMGYGMGSIGLARIIPGYAFTITSLLVLFFTILKASGILFAFKDYDMLMALPVQTTTVITSRFLLMYGMNVLISLVIMLPMGVAYSIWVHPHMIFYVMWLIAIFVTPLVPMTIAAVIGAIISAISAKFKHTNIISIILSFALLIGFMSLSMSAGTMNTGQIDIRKLAALGAMLSKKMNQIYPLTGIMEKAICQYSAASFLVFLVISVIWYYVFVKIVSIKYIAINTGLTSHQTKSNYKLQSLTVLSPLKTLYLKEMRRFFASYLYVVNVGVGAMILIVTSIAFFVIGIDKMEQLIGIPGIKSMIMSFVPFAISGLLAMTCTTAVSLSLEGKNLWILQSAPIDAATIYRSKMAVNIAILLPVSLLSSLLMSLSLKSNIMLTVWIFVIPLVYVGLTSVWGIFINLKIPNFTWDSEVIVIKQSMSSMFGGLGGMIFGIIPIGILLLLPGVDRNLLAGIITLVVIGITALLYKKVCESELPR
ncbi:MAG: putative ABC transporter permease subunit [Clostridium sp.]|uniref:putative ABC transporter permease subunit n=1 Tax=Clostridium sp. TaxID=1506 RepID=UPI003D6C7A4D